MGQEHVAGKPRLTLVGQEPNPGDDAALIAALLAGERRAAAALFDRYAPFVRTLLRRQLGPAAEVDDLTQEVFLRLFPRVSRLRDPGALRAFVTAFTVRVARTELTSRWVRRWLRLSPRGETPEVVAPGSDFEARETVARLYRVLDELSPQARTLFVLRYIEGLENQDIASAAGISLATVKRHLTRVCKHVFARMGKDPQVMAYLQRGDGT